MLRVPVLLMMLLTSLWTVVSADELSDLERRLSAVTTLRADFTQVKEVGELKSTLSSSGEMLISQKKGLLWQQKEPFELSFVMTGDKLIQKIPGQEDMVIDAMRNPQMFELISSLKEIVRGSCSSLSENFASELVKTEGERFELILTPVSRSAALVFKKLTVTGEKYVDKVVIEDTQGDITRIEFSSIKAGDNSLSASEEASFAQ